MGWLIQLCFGLNSNVLRTTMNSYDNLIFGICCNNRVYLKANLFDPLGILFFPIHIADFFLMKGLEETAFSAKNKIVPV